MSRPLAKRSQASTPAWERGANDEQLEVIRHETGPCRVLSCAGSGKTFCVTRRMVRLVNLRICAPDRIVAVTFAKKAADEMNKRIVDLGVSGARVGTWHSLGLQILREDHTPQGRWTIQDSGPGTSPKIVLKDVLGYKGMDWKGADTNAINGFIGRCKSNLHDPSSEGAAELAKKSFGFQAPRVLEAFQRYNDALAEKELLTFDDYLVFVAAHLSVEENRATWAARWDQFLCDEKQDDNFAQSEVARLLSMDHGNYMAVGDCFQAIYGFRGSSPDYLASFEQHWPGAKTIVLPRNYRSGRAIISVANAIVAPAKVPGLAPTAMIGERDLEGKVTILCAEALDDEAGAVVDTLTKSVELGETKLSDHTVLYRTNAQSRAIEEELLAKRVPYVVVGGTSFYERREVRDLLAYLRLANGDGKVDDIKRSINTPFRFLGNRFVERVMDAVEGRDLEAVDWPSVIERVSEGERIQGRQRASAVEWATMIRGMRETIEKAARLTEEAHPESPIAQAKREAAPAQLLEHIVKSTKYIDYLNREEGSETTEDSGGANVRELIRVAERFPTASALLEYIDETIRAAREQRADKQAGGERVLLMTVHRSKGLEWPNVYVIGMNEEILPHKKGDPEEERRLAYVACTRARDALCLSYVRRIATRAGIRDVSPSRFLLDTGLSLDGPLGEAEGELSDAEREELELEAAELEAAELDAAQLDAAQLDADRARAETIDLES